MKISTSNLKWQNWYSRVDTGFLVCGIYPEWPMRTAFKITDGPEDSSARWELCYHTTLTDSCTLKHTCHSHTPPHTPILQPQTHLGKWCFRHTWAGLKVRKDQKKEFTRTKILGWWVKLSCLWWDVVLSCIVPWMKVHVCSPACRYTNGCALTTLGFSYTLLWITTESEFMVFGCKKPVRADIVPFTLSAMGRDPTLHREYPVRLTAASAHLGIDVSLLVLPITSAFWWRLCVQSRSQCDILFRFQMGIATCKNHSYWYPNN